MAVPLAPPSPPSPDPPPLFPPLHTADVLACQFSQWYPRFRRVSPKATVVRPIPDEDAFVDYLESDGLFLPEGSGHMGCVTWYPQVEGARLDVDDVLISRTLSRAQSERTERLGRRRTHFVLVILVRERRRRRPANASPPPPPVLLPAPQRRDPCRDREVRWCRLSKAQLVVAAGP